MTYDTVHSKEYWGRGHREPNPEIYSLQCLTSSVPLNRDVSNSIAPFLKLLHNRILGRPSTFVNLLFRQPPEDELLRQPERGQRAFEGSQLLERVDPFDIARSDHASGLEGGIPDLGDLLRCTSSASAPLPDEHDAESPLGSHGQAACVQRAAEPITHLLPWPGFPPASAACESRRRGPRTT